MSEVYLYLKLLEQKIRAQFVSEQLFSLQVMFRRGETRTDR